MKLDDFEMRDHPNNRMISHLNKMIKTNKKRIGVTKTRYNDLKKEYDDLKLKNKINDKAKNKNDDVYDDDHHHRAYLSVMESDEEDNNEDGDDIEVVHQLSDGLDFDATLSKIRKGTDIGYEKVLNVSTKNGDKTQDI